MNILRKQAEAMDGQLRDRPIYLLPVDEFPVDSKFLYDLIVTSSQHRLHDHSRKRASMQLMIMSTSDGPIIAFTGRPGYNGQSHKDIAEYDDIDPAYCPEWNSLSAFLNSNKNKQIDGYLLHDENPKSAIKPLSKSSRQRDSPTPTLLDSLIDGVRRSPHQHLIVITIRPKIIRDYDEEKSGSSVTDQIIDGVINHYKNKADKELNETDRVYHLQPAELLAHSADEACPPEPIIDRLRSLSTSDHKYSTEKVRTNMAADKIAYASTDIKRQLYKYGLYRADGKKRTLELYQQDMPRPTQRHWY